MSATLGEDILSSDAIVSIEFRLSDFRRFPIFVRMDSFDSSRIQLLLGGYILEVQFLIAFLVNLHSTKMQPLME